MASKKNMLSEVQTLINARIPVLWFLSGEEARAENALANLAANYGYKETKAFCAIWSLTTGEDGKPGWCTPDGWDTGTFKGSPIPDEFLDGDPKKDDKEKVHKKNQVPHGAILHLRDFALKNPQVPSIIIIRDAHQHLKNDNWRRAIKDCSRKLRDTLTNLVLVSVSDDLPADLKSDIAIVKPGLPTVEVLELNAKKTVDKLGATNVDPKKCAMALRGLGVQQANDLIKKDAVANKCNIDTERLSKLKAEELASVHGVHFGGESDQMGEVGGLERFKKWLDKRQYAFTQKARDRGIDEPRGCVFVGVPGGGKTLTARAVAAALKRPLIILNLSECEGGIVGETGTRIAEALRTIDALAPCVLLVDEIEKALGTGKDNDGGSKKTLVRSLLIWLQERESQVFTCITSNDISGLPPELTRKGRTDEIWFVDLPNQKGREDILRIHLGKRSNRSLPETQLAKIANELNGYTGSEIEESVKEGILTAWARYCEDKSDNDDVTAKDILEAASEIVPMSITYGAKLHELRKWADGRARYASDPDPEPLSKPTKKPTKKGKGAAEQPPAPGTVLIDEKALNSQW